MDFERESSILSESAIGEVIDKEISEYILKQSEDSSNSNQLSKHKDLETIKSLAQRFVARG
jgi:hypothetical protein